MPSDEFRPRVHFTPPQNWMNDPNGLVFDGEVYHLFYQHNPYGKNWGHMSWGHAVSPDTVRWDHLPIAITEEPDAGYTIFSGSAVIDLHNTSGFGQADRPPMVAVYTADYATDPRLETIHVASSTDGGRTFTKYAGDPVIDTGERKFGDPKVFWHHPTQRWILVAICGHEQGHVVLYASPDLKTWTRLSTFHAPEAAPGVWECPDLFPLRLDGDPAQIRWVLKVNNVPAPGRPAATRYFVGDFDGERFTGAVPTGQGLTSDDGAIYAEVTYNHVPDGRRILMGWLREQAHPDRAWTGAQSLPRVLTLHTGTGGQPELRQRPVVDVQALRRDRWTFGTQHVRGTLGLTGVDLESRALEIIAVFDLTPDARAAGLRRYGVRLALSDDREVRVGIETGPQGGAEGITLFVEPGGDGASRVTAPFTPQSDVVTLRVFFDQAIVEAFAGESTADMPAGATAFIPYGATYEHLALFATTGGGEAVPVGLEQADVWTLRDVRGA